MSRGGAEFQELAGSFVPGQRFSVQQQAVRFPANRCMHGTCAWTAFDRVLLVAYMPGRWGTLSAPLLQQLTELGFQLPQPLLPMPSNYLQLSAEVSEGALIRSLRACCCRNALRTQKHRLSTPCKPTPTLQQSEP